MGTSVAYSYLEILQVLGDDICPHLFPFNDICSVLGVPTHRARPVSLVESAADVFGRHLEVAVPAHREGLCRSHGGGRTSRRVCAVERDGIWLLRDEDVVVGRGAFVTAKGLGNFGGAEKLRDWFWWWSSQVLLGPGSLGWVARTRQGYEYRS